MSKIVVSKFRNVFPTPAKNVEQQYTQIKANNTINDFSNSLAANNTHYAVSWQSAGGGKLAILPLDKKGRQEEVFFFTGHTGPILDWAFHPFANNLIASASDDATVRVWEIPEGGLKDNVSDARITLTGHSRKVSLLLFHHAANHTLLSSGFDNLIKFWDLEKGEKWTLDVHKDNVSGMSLNLDGSLLATACKDKQIRIIDPRNAQVAQSALGHGGTKVQKVLWAKRRDQLISFGSSKTQQREIFVWDPRKLDSKLYELDLDNASGALMPFYDEDTNVLYVGGKGDGNIRYYELWDNTPPLVHLSEYQSAVPQRGLAMLPKTALDTSVCEVARILRMENDKIIPVSFQCPRKTAAQEFQADVYPDTFSSSPALSADEYFGGENKPPQLVSMKDIAASTPVSAPSAFTPSSSKPISASDIETQRKKVETLRAQLKQEEEILAQLESRS